MLNRIMLIGTVLEQPDFSYDPHGDKVVTLSLSVPPPSDAPPTYLAVSNDIRGFGAPGWTTGDDAFLVVCRDEALSEQTLQSVQTGDLVYVEGQLVLTLLHLLPLAEILASDVVVLKAHSAVR